MARRRKNVYLGKRVPDIGRPGLDTITEVRGIVGEIIKDVKGGRITYRTGMSRLNFLSLIVTRSRYFTGRKLRKAKFYINKGRITLKKLKPRTARLRHVPRPHNEVGLYR